MHFNFQMQKLQLNEVAVKNKETAAECNRARPMDGETSRHGKGGLRAAAGRF